jgi:hypothetical protein
VTFTIAVEVQKGSVPDVTGLFLEEGLEVTYDGPMEKRAGGFEHEIVQIVFYLKDNAGAGIVGGAGYAAVQAAVKKIREYFPEATIGEIEETEEDDPDI